MSDDIHKKAASLMAASRVEGISESDRAWLSLHLDECASCAAHAGSLDNTVAALRSFRASPDPKVLESTRRRVRIRAQELRERQARVRGLWIACVFSWLLGACSAPLLWAAFQWLGVNLDLPKPLWVFALGVYWIVPAALGAAVLAKKWASASDEEETVSRIIR
jgi:anti-sigma factor RsiW